jgi:ribosome-binding factor A
MSGFRIEKVASTLQRAVQKVLSEKLSDPRTERSMLTVTEVNVSPDLKQATVKVSVLPEQHEKRCLAAMSAASAYIRREAGEMMALRQLPALRFEIDRSLKQQKAVFDALGQVVREREEGDEAEAREQRPEEGRAQGEDLR